MQVGNALRYIQFLPRKHASPHVFHIWEAETSQQCCGSCAPHTGTANTDDVLTFELLEFLISLLSQKERLDNDDLWGVRFV